MEEEERYRKTKGRESGKEGETTLLLLPPPPPLPPYLSLSKHTHTGKTGMGKGERGGEEDRTDRADRERGRVVVFGLTANGREFIFLLFPLLRRRWGLSENGLSRFWGPRRVARHFGGQKKEEQRVVKNTLSFPCPHKASLFWIRMHPLWWLDA